MLAGAGLPTFPSEVHSRGSQQLYSTLDCCLLLVMYVMWHKACMCA